MPSGKNDMKITRKQLEQIILEELEGAIREGPKRPIRRMQKTKKMFGRTYQRGKQRPWTS